MKKKLTLVIMLVLVIFGAYATFCYADEIVPQDFFTDGFRCQLNNDGVKTYTIVGYDSTIYTNIIPEEIDGYKITRIADDAFKDKPQLTGKIEIPNSIISIGNNAFSGCPNITGVKLGNSVKEVGNSAFAECSALKTVELSNVEKIGSNVFYKCETLESTMEIPSTVKSLGDSVFYMSTVSKVVFLSNNAPTITKNTFNNNIEMKINVPKHGNGYTAQNNWPETTDAYIVDGDINMDGLVDSADAAIVLNLFKYNNATQTDIDLADLDDNGLLDSADAAIILNIFKYSI